MRKFGQMVNVVRLIAQVSPVFFPLTAAVKLLYASLPFINIVMSSIILDKLIARADIRALLLLAAVTMGANVLINLTANAIEKYRGIVNSVGYHRYNELFVNKFMSMDYSSIENPETHKKYAIIENDRNTGNGGWWSITRYVDVMFETFFGVIFSVIVVAGLFTAHASAGLIDSPWFSVAFAAAVLLSGVSTFPVDKRFFKHIYSILEVFSSGNMMFMHMNELVANYKNGKDIRIYNASGLIDREARKIWDEVGFIGFKALCINDGLLKGVKAVISTLTGGLVYLFVALRAVAGSLSMGQIVRYTSGITQFITSFSGLINTINTFAITAERMENVFEFLALPSALYRGTLAVEKRDDREYEISFRNVSFKYPGSDEYVLRNFSLSINIGKRLAVVGMNGSGKTTMIKLLCRLYDPTEGEITLNGIDIRRYKYEEYLSLFSVVFQDFQLFSLPLSHNVATSFEYDETRIKMALMAAGFGERLSTLPNGIGTLLYKNLSEDGVEISGGEAQKIALARALYKNVPFIILDEPTAALDPISEYEIYSKFDDIVGSRTAIYISHRLSSCRFCDDIAVFDGGHIVQRGGHEELLADEGGLYCQLWRVQAQYYVQEKYTA